MPKAEKINSLRRRCDRHLANIQIITESIDDYEQSGSHNINALKTYEKALADEWGRLQLVYGDLIELDDEEHGNECTTYKNYIHLKIRLKTLMQSEPPVNSSKPTSSELRATTVLLPEIRLPTIDGRPSIKNLSETDRRCEEQVRDNAQRTSEGQPIVDFSCNNRPPSLEVSETLVMKRIASPNRRSQTVTNPLHASTTADQAELAQSWKIEEQPSIENISDSDRPCEEIAQDKVQRNATSPIQRRASVVRSLKHAVDETHRLSQALIPNRDELVSRLHDGSTSRLRAGKSRNSCRLKPCQIQIDHASVT
jgi:hypothetical protein